MPSPVPTVAPKMSLWNQLWGTTFEKIHTVGTGFLGLSLVAFLVTRPLSKIEALVTFCIFGVGCAFIGCAMLCNAWRRWRTGRDQLILVRRRHPDAPTHIAELHLLGRRIHWQGPIAHVDTGTFGVSRLAEDCPPPSGSVFLRAYGLFRAAYWAGCSSIAFQAVFGLSAFLYGAWLMKKLHQYLMSAA